MCSRLWMTLLTLDVRNMCLSFTLLKLSLPHTKRIQRVDKDFSKTIVCCRPIYVKSILHGHLHILHSWIDIHESSWVWYCKYFAYIFEERDSKNWITGSVRLSFISLKKMGDGGCWKGKTLNIWNNYNVYYDYLISKS